MTHSLKRNKTVVREKLDLADEQGRVVKTLTIEADADTVAKNVSRQHLDLVHAYQRIKDIRDDMEKSASGESAMEKSDSAESAIQKNGSEKDAIEDSAAGMSEKRKPAVYEEELKDALEEAGRAAGALYETLFGRENAAKILEFYEGRLIEMNLQVTPFLIKVLIPKIREAVKEKKRQAAGRYGLGKAPGGIPGKTFGDAPEKASGSAAANSPAATAENGSDSGPAGRRPWDS